MQNENITEFRKHLPDFFKARQRVTINHKSGAMVLIPAEELEKIEFQAIAYEMDHIRATQKLYSGEEVEAMLAEVLNRKK
ncbi:MAG: hypothetical protein A2527_06250 [Candidatus Lambdaproteobacteria bacterium RIFOXYD2_FULL_50_16]|uniref:Antitoxin n=1 Tax=Candidatus Lambdaproteobacteria bacterium RIFOXYD2_FULL_50_16 TaxID=1817772 RepID=A0A1F6G9Z8_9PROT|nr:MAG: hypothetical protein A2527_06250 [Candidatus Lambdaproteobacteria bacterium RIFOXYD2_FULL_50_16]